jgi:carbon storage regulator
MLVLSRRLGERINIGNDITLTVVSIDRNKVKLGLVAPKEVRVLRTELLCEHCHGTHAPGPCPTGGEG